ncbi:MAG: HNH endonuclease [Gammaproteobacteria bacterium]|nr:HNH endonuclease [Gammaproteobacteria bacterium]
MIIAKQINTGGIVYNPFTHYVITDKGDIYNLKTLKLIKGWVNANGYRRVELSNGKESKQYYIHRLVALTFIGNDRCVEKCEVNHIDRDRYNCKLDNLEWVTKKYNLEYRYNNYTKKYDEIQH